MGWPSTRTRTTPRAPSDGPTASQRGGGCQRDGWLCTPPPCRVSPARRRLRQCTRDGLGQTRHRHDRSGGHDQDAAEEPVGVQEARIAVTDTASAPVRSRIRLCAYLTRAPRTRARARARPRRRPQPSGAARPARQPGRSPLPLAQQKRPGDEHERHHESGEVAQSLLHRRTPAGSGRRDQFGRRGSSEMALPTLLVAPLRRAADQGMLPQPMRLRGLTEAATGDPRDDAHRARRRAAAPRSAALRVPSVRSACGATSCGRWWSSTARRRCR